MDYFIPTSQHLGLALRSERKKKGLTQQEAGHRVGLYAKTVSALENHPGSATIESLMKLLSALDLELVVAPKKAAKGEEW